MNRKEEEEEEGERGRNMMENQPQSPQTPQRTNQLNISTPQSKHTDFSKKSPSQSPHLSPSLNQQHSKLSPTERSQEAKKNENQRNISRENVKNENLEDNGSNLVRKKSLPKPLSPKVDTSTETSIPGSPTSSIFPSFSSLLTPMNTLFGPIDRMKKMKEKLSKELESQKGKFQRKEEIKWTPKTLNEILRKNNFLVSFMEFMEVNNASIFLEFWLTIQSYRNSNLLGNQIKDALLNDARSLSERFLTDEFSKLFHIEEGERKKIFEKIEKKDNVDQIFDVFFGIQKRVYIIMENNYFEPFLQSHFFSDVIGLEENDEPTFIENLTPPIDKSKNLEKQESQFPLTSSESKILDSSISSSSQSQSQAQIERTQTQTNIPQTQIQNEPSQSQNVNTSSNSNSNQNSNPTTNQNSIQVPNVIVTPSGNVKKKSGLIRIMELKDILTNSAPLFYFMQFADRFNEVKHMINFWLTVESYGQQYNIENEDDILRQDAKLMFNLHFTQNSPQPIKVLPKKLLLSIRSYIENKKLTKTEPISTFECIIRAQRLVYEYLTKKYFKKFLESQYYYDYRKEALKRLAQESSGQNEDFIPDTDIVNDAEEEIPRSCVRGRSNSSLRIGHLDELGFFVNDTDAEIDHDIYSEEINEGNKGLFESILKSGHENDEESHAKEIARNIIKEITKNLGTAYAEEDAI